MKYLTIFNNDATVLGLLIMMLTLIFIMEKSQNKYCQVFFKYIPALLLCYFLVIESYCYIVIVCITILYIGI